MRRSRLAPLDGNQFPLTLAVGLRAAFADVASEPIPQKLATLLRSAGGGQSNQTRSRSRATSSCIGSSMSSSEEYRAKAKECDERAGEVQDQETKSQWFGLAQQWREMAANLERNRF